MYKTHNVTFRNKVIRKNNAESLRSESAKKTKKSVRKVIDFEDDDDVSEKSMDNFRPNMDCNEKRACFVNLHKKYDDDANDSDSPSKKSADRFSIIQSGNEIKKLDFEKTKSSAMPILNVVPTTPIKKETTVEDKKKFSRSSLLKPTNIIEEMAKEENAEEQESPEMRVLRNRTIIITPGRKRECKTPRKTVALKDNTNIILNSKATKENDDSESDGKKKEKTSLQSKPSYQSSNAVQKNTPFKGTLDMLHIIYFYSTICSTFYVFPRFYNLRVLSLFFNLMCNPQIWLILLKTSVTSMNLIVTYQIITLGCVSV